MDHKDFSWRLSLESKIFRGDMRLHKDFSWRNSAISLKNSKDGERTFLR